MSAPIAASRHLDHEAHNVATACLRELGRTKLKTRCLRLLGKDRGLRTMSFL
jgi:hypothetical protein